MKIACTQKQDFMVFWGWYELLFGQQLFVKTTKFCHQKKFQPKIGSLGQLFKGLPAKKGSRNQI